MAKRQKETLSVEQERAAGLLASGQTSQEVAAALGVAPEALASWGASAEFVAEVNRERRRLWEAGEDQLRALVPKALQVLRDGMAQTEDLKLRQNAAAHVLRAVGLYGNVGQPTGPTSADQVRYYDLLASI